MKVLDNVLGAIGHTPLVRLSRVTDGLPVTLLAKVEFLNPGGSVKDRIGLAMIDDAERRGALRPGGVIVEATAGNTGVGLALVAALKGYRCLFVVPDKMSDEKIDLLKAYGAEVVVTPTSVPPDSPRSYNGVADRLARELPNAWRPNQFANPLNPDAHYRTTGPEIWRDTDGEIDVLVAGMGTGGTISGTGRYLKEQKPSVVVVGADPVGSILSGDTPCGYKVEGIGEDFIPSTFNRQAVDEMVRVSDQESFAMARRLAREEGLLAGGSSGTAVAAALKYARRLPPRKVVVAVLPDTGRNYQSKIFSDRWMADNGFLDAAPTLATTGEVLGSKRRLSGVLAVRPTDLAVEVVAVMERHGVSQVPVVDGASVVGAVDETTLLALLAQGLDPALTPIERVMGKPLPTLDEGIPVAEAQRLLLAGHDGVVVTRGGEPVGLLTRFDLVRHSMDARTTRA